MRYVPISLFTALVVKDIFISPEYTVTIVNRAPEMIAAVIVIGIAYWTRSMAISVVLGLVAVFLLAMVVWLPTYKEGRGIAVSYLSAFF